VGNQIGNQASFDPRNYGYRKLSDLIEATELFEIKRQGQIVLIRDKRNDPPRVTRKASAAPAGRKRP
jgi:hypothetical protein